MGESDTGGVGAGSTLARLEEAALLLNEEPESPLRPRGHALFDAAVAHLKAPEEERLAGLLAAARTEERERCALLLEAWKAEFAEFADPAALGALTNAIGWVREGRGPEQSPLRLEREPTDAE